MVKEHHRRTRADIKEHRRQWETKEWEDEEDDPQTKLEFFDCLGHQI